MEMEILFYAVKASRNLPIKIREVFLRCRGASELEKNHPPGMPGAGTMRKSGNHVPGLSHNEKTPPTLWRVSGTMQKRLQQCWQAPEQCYFVSNNVFGAPTMLEESEQCENDSTNVKRALGSDSVSGAERWPGCPGGRGASERHRRAGDAPPSPWPPKGLVSEATGTAGRLRSGDARPVRSYLRRRARDVEKRLWHESPGGGGRSTALSRHPLRSRSASLHVREARR